MAAFKLLISLDNTMKTLFNILFLCFLSFSAFAQVDSTIISFPVNDSIVKAFALTDETIKFLPKFSIDDENDLNDNGEMWFYLYVIEPTPPIDFESESGMKKLEIHGPFGKEFMSAKDTIELGLKPPYFTNIDSTGNPVTKFTMPSLNQEGLYLVSVMTYYKNATLSITPSNELIGVTKPGEVVQQPGPCIDCTEDAYPNPGSYIFNAWVSIDNPEGKITFLGLGPLVNIRTTQGNSTSTTQSITSFVGNVSDGWQLMEGVFTIPTNCTYFEVVLTSSSGNVYFDDVRFFPTQGSMKSYVYDPFTFRYIAELDERHFATFYEYDEEGKLKRVKKETERGVMTIQESINSQLKRNVQE
jgi:hypothetical protein